MNLDASLNKDNKAEFLSGKQLVAFETSKEHYQAVVAVVWCFDDRLSPALEAFLKAKNITHKDLVCIAGCLKTLCLYSLARTYFVKNC